MSNFKIVAGLLNYRSIGDKTIRLTFETNELSPEQMAAIHQSLQMTGLLAFLTEEEHDMERTADES